MDTVPGGAFRTPIDMGLIDAHGRRINYLRLSVTDRCNLRCCYCMPAEGVPKLCHSDIVSYEDLYRIARESVALGIEKIRITGGEPLVRKGIIGFLERVSAIGGLKELVLTTNGMLLREMAAPLRRAGVQRLNVSLDSLKPATFATITRGGDLRWVLDGLAAAEQAGFPPPKINAVVMRGLNDDEVLDFAELTLRKAYTVRFIEYMPTTRNQGWKSLCVTGTEILERIGSRYKLETAEDVAGTGPARNYRIRGAAGAIGVITPVSSHFCGSCNRIRVTASGLAKGCLFGNQAVDLKPYLAQAGNESLRQALRRIVTAKPRQHELSLLHVEPRHAAFAMSQVGG
jgi:cyclic pyranopterin phosphate synthase